MMERLTRQQAIELLYKYPYKFGHLVGFTKLTKLHNNWIKDMLNIEADDGTLQAHRGSFKTTCISIALAAIVVLMPQKRALFMRKTDADIKEIMLQVMKILNSEYMRYLVQCIYGIDLKFTKNTSNEISTNLTNDVKGTAQITGRGTSGSITGKHYDLIFTDDIINIDDRYSEAERERTKRVYQELQNLKNQGGRIYNTGTPWHKEDCFLLMPEPKKFDCYSTNLLSEVDIDNLKSVMLPSLFAANYELKHIASEDVIFTDPETGAEPSMIEQGAMQLDSAFYGSDFTAWTIMRKIDNKYYVYGQLRRKHVEDCYGEIMADYNKFMCGKLYTETNADKGMVGKDLRRLNAKVILYAETMNKFLKISTYLRAIWKDVFFIKGTDPEYINQICEFTEDAAHDDAPDSAASLARLLYFKDTPKTYKSLFTGEMING